MAPAATLEPPDTKGAPKNNAPVNAFDQFIDQMTPAQAARLMEKSGLGKAPAADDGAITAEMKAEFFKPENLRPNTEIYYVSTFDGSPDFTLCLSAQKQKGLELVTDGDNLSYIYTPPPHRMGTDLWVANRGVKVLMVELTNHHELKITAADIEACRQSGYRLPKDIKPQNPNGHFTLGDIQAALATDSAGIMRNTPISKDDLHPRSMDGEAFRTWLKKKYAYMELQRTQFQGSALVTEDVSRLSAITGNMPAIPAAVVGM